MKKEIVQEMHAAYTANKGKGKGKNGNRPWKPKCKFGAGCRKGVKCDFYHSASELQSFRAAGAKGTGK